MQLPYRPSKFKSGFQFSDPGKALLGDISVPVILGVDNLALPQSDLDSTETKAFQSLKGKEANQSMQKVSPCGTCRLVGFRHTILGGSSLIYRCSPRLHQKHPIWPVTDSGLFLPVQQTALL